MTHPRPHTGVAAVVAQRLADAGDERTRQWWERYMRGAVPFRGVRMAEIRRIVAEVWNAEGIADLLPIEQIEIALRQFAEPYCEDKLAGVLALSELLLGHLTLDDVGRLAAPFVRDQIADWNTCDWYCVKVLGRFVATGPDRRERAEVIAAWREAGSLWQRRAAAVSFVNLAPQGDWFYDGFVDLLLTVCAHNVADPARFSQTSVGWLLRELSAPEQERVREFVDSHRDTMSAEVVKNATAKLAKHFQEQ